MIAALVVASVLVQVLMLLSGRLTPDQVMQLELAVDYVDGGHLQPFGPVTSGGGRNPGCLTQLLLALPLELWPDYRAPRVLMVAGAAAACLLLARVLREAAGRRFATVYVAIYALSPWFLYWLGSWINVSFLFLPAAAHLWACWRLREARRAFPSVVLGLVLAMTVQLHPSAVLLVLWTVMLVDRGEVRPAPLWTAAGAGLGAVTLVPTFAALRSGTLQTVAMPGADPGFGILQLLEGASVLVRMGSPLLRPALYDYNVWLAEDPRGPLVGATVLALCRAAALLSLLASVAYFRPLGIPEHGPWLRRYAQDGFAAAMIACALSPVFIKEWQLLPALHAACLPVAAWMAERWTSARRVACAGVVLASLSVVLLFIVGHPWYRQGVPPSPQIRRLVPMNQEQPGAGVGRGDQARGSAGTAPRS